MDTTSVQKWVDDLQSSSQPSFAFNASNAIEGTCQMLRDHLHRPSGNLPEGAFATKEFLRAQALYTELIKELRGALEKDLRLTGPVPARLYAVLDLHPWVVAAFGEIERCEAVIMKKNARSKKGDGKREQVLSSSEMHGEKHDDDLKYFWGRERAELQEILRALKVLKERNEKASEGVDNVRKQLRRDMDELEKGLMLRERVDQCTNRSSSTGPQVYRVK
ncbi:hypothetical protein EYC84_001993 [Monilinia fructicola]|uniref:Uncharacterized protein n=1 Tax=Monilinia fructicola TaxID=38448 RepID=A0A5M9JRD3_MONFR|nr:hypothetical protein EYC84_001993 [Monilinia fructicola]